MVNKKILFAIGLFFTINLFLSNIFAVDVICKKGDGVYEIERHNSVVWTTEESMYRNGARAVLRLSLKFVKDGKERCFVYDRLLDYLPYNNDSIVSTIKEVDNLTNFLIGGLTSLPQIAFQVDSIDIFSANCNGFGYNLDIVDVVASPYMGFFSTMPRVTFQQRYFSLFTYVSGR